MKNQKGSIGVYLLVGLIAMAIGGGVVWFVLKQPTVPAVSVSNTTTEATTSQGVEVQKVPSSSVKQPAAMATLTPQAGSTNSADAVIVAFLGVKQTLASLNADASRSAIIKIFSGFDPQTDAAISAKIKGMSDQDIVMFAQTLAATMPTEQALKSNMAQVHIDNNTAKISWLVGGDQQNGVTYTATFKKVNGRWEF